MSDEPMETPVAEPASTAPDDGGRRRIGLAALAIMAVHFLARIGGFVQKKVLAHFFGTELAADAASAMQRVFELIYYIPEELLTHSLLPVFTRTRNEDGEAAAWQMASLTGTLQALLLLLTSAAFWLYGDTLCGWALGRPDPAEADFAQQVARFELTVRLVRVAMLGLFCTSIGSLTYVLLNAYKRFVTPAMGDVAQKAGIILGTVVVCKGFSELGPMGYAYGFILGGVFKLLTHLVALRGKISLVRPSLRVRNPRLRELGWLMLPLLAGTLVSKLRDFLETRIIWAVPVEGTLASLDYARKVIWMPVSVIPYALGIALFPFLAEWAQRRDKDRVTEAFLGASRLMLFIFLPMTAGFALLDREIVTFLYRSGKFGEFSVDLTTGPFLIYALGMAFYGLEIIALQVFYSHRDTTTPFYLGLVGSTLHVLVAWFAGLVLGWNNIGIALGFVVAKAVKVLLMWWRLHERITGYDWPGLASLVAKTLAATVAMGLALGAAKIAGHRVMNLDDWKLAMVFLAAAGTVGGTVFFAMAVWLRVPELEIVKDIVKRKLLRRGGSQ